MDSQHERTEPVVDPHALVSTSVAAGIAGRTDGYIRKLCRAGRIEGAVQVDGRWMVPASWAATVTPGGASEPATWQLERDFLHAEVAGLERQQLVAQLESLRRELERAVAEVSRLKTANARLRAAAAAALEAAAAVDGA